MKISVTEERLSSGLEIKDLSKLEIISIPIGVTLYVSNKPRFNEGTIYTAKNNSVINVRTGIDGYRMAKLYLYWSGVSNDKIEFRTHAIASDYNWIEHIERSTQTSLTDAVTNAILAQDFSPKGGDTFTIAAGATKEYLIDGKKKIRFSANDLLDVTFDDNTTALAMIKDDISVLNINEKVSFKNTNSSGNIDLKIWWC